MTGLDPKLKQQRVLIVEDDATTRMVLEQLLRHRGHEVESCDRAEQALEILRDSFYPFIILDLMLPGMTGLEFCRKIRSLPGGDLYYILIGTAHHKLEDLQGILASGADDYMTKPYDPRLLNIRFTVAEQQVERLALQKSMEARLKYLAAHDPLTSLRNRNQLFPVMDEMMQQEALSALLFLDLDYFKIVNDTAGHAAGDRLLVELSSLFRSCLRNEDYIFRLGGDEFLAVLSRTGKQQALAIAERLKNAVETYVFRAQDRMFRLGVSIGLYMVEGGMKAEEMLSAADTACYSAKIKGKNQIVVYDKRQAGGVSAVRDQDWITKIQQAIDKETLAIWFQPIVDLGPGTVAMHEVLVRYIDPIDGRIHLPSVFMGALERAAKSFWLDLYVLRKALQAIRENDSLRLSVNISGASLNRPEFEKDLTELLDGVPAGRLILEITETFLISNLDSVRRLMERLKERGVRFALDDFGTGFSSLMYLQNLPVQYIKIGNPFVCDLDEGTFNRALLNGLVEISRVMGIRVVAECVEEVAIMEALRAMGVSYAQGYYIGKPDPKPVAKVLLQA